MNEETCAHLNCDCEVDNAARWRGTGSYGFPSDGETYLFWNALTAYDRDDGKRRHLYGNTNLYDVR